MEIHIFSKIVWTCQNKPKVEVYDGRQPMSLKSVGMFTLESSAEPVISMRGTKGEMGCMNFFVCSSFLKS